MIENRNFFVDLSHVYGKWELIENGKIISSGNINTDYIGPQSRQIYELPPFNLSHTNREYAVNFRFALKNDHSWAESGHIVASDQVIIQRYDGPRYHKGGKQNNKKVQVKENGDRVVVSAVGRDFDFDLSTGQLAQVTKANESFIVNPIIHNIWRAPTDNDEGGDGKSFASRWLKSGYNDMKRQVVNVNRSYTDDGLFQLSVDEKYFSDSANITVKLVYTILQDGDLHITGNTNIPEGLPVVPKIGLSFQIDKKYSNLQWYGRGPHESYIDRKHSAFFGRYSGTVRDQYYPYIRPQENGNKTDIRWASISDEKGSGVLIYGLPTFNLSVHQYSLDNLTKATHTHMIKDDGPTTVNLDHLVMGLGGDDSWNPRTHKEYLIPSGTYSYSFTLRFSDNIKADERRVLDNRVSKLSS